MKKQKIFEQEKYSFIDNTYTISTNMAQNTVNDNSSYTGFFANMRSNYGIKIKNALITYSKLNIQLAKLFPKLIFLVRCRKNKVYPNFIQNATKEINNLNSEHPFITKIDSIATKTKKALLSIHIKISNWEINSKTKS